MICVFIKMLCCTAKYVYFHKSGNSLNYLCLLKEIKDSKKCHSKTYTSICFHLLYIKDDTEALALRNNSEQQPLGRRRVADYPHQVLRGGNRPFCPPHTLSQWGFFLTTLWNNLHFILLLIFLCIMTMSLWRVGNLRLSVSMRPLLVTPWP
jgi:hypothetical protein